MPSLQSASAIIRMRRKGCKGRESLTCPDPDAEPNKYYEVHIVGACNAFPCCTHPCGMASSERSMFSVSRFRSGPPSRTSGYESGNPGVHQLWDELGIRPLSSSPGASIPDYNNKKQVHKLGAWDAAAHCTMSRKPNPNKCPR